jgi:dienelactone hydrolase
MKPDPHRPDGATWKGDSMEAMSSVRPMTEQIRSLDADVLPAHERQGLADMLERDLHRRHEATNRRDAAAWAQVTSREAWERLLAPRREALRASLGCFPSSPAELKTWTTGSVDGDGFRIENVVFESRPEVFVTANLYLPSPRRDGMPALLIVHSHHNPKTHGELQEMGMTWARQGCMVLVMDQLGCGERRQHRAGPRQDYRFRFITGIQLHLIGESLMGWMVWDIRRGIDLLLRQPGADAEKMILIGAVAGGGDPAAVAAALDARVRCVIPFNFGGPQPETPYPLPDDAEDWFDTMGAGSWESTRNLRLSGRDGFLPWVIVGAVAPRRLVYSHEFSWDRERDPVWKRMQRVFAFTGAPEHLAFAHGAGVLSGRPPEATHCNHVGAVHRRMLYPPLQRWFGIPEPDEEYPQRLPEEALACIPAGADEAALATAAVADGPPLPRPRPLHVLWGEIGASRAEAMRAKLSPLTPGARRERLRQEWARLLGEIEPAADPVVELLARQELQGVRIDRLRLTVEPEIVVPVLFLAPTAAPRARQAVVVAFSQQGKAPFLHERAGEIATLVEGGAAVCLPDLRGTGETCASVSREPRGGATAISATEWMLGQTLLGSRLRDLRSVRRYLRTRPDTDAARFALWGDSFAPANAPGFPDPLLGEEEPPGQSEPLGGLLALFGALYEDGIAAVAVRGNLAGYLSVLGDSYCYVPHDAIVPGALTAGDLCDVAAALAPCPLRLEGLVDGRNCRLPDTDVQRLFEPTARAYRAAEGTLMIRTEPADDLAPWLLHSVSARGSRTARRRK